MKLWTTFCPSKVCWELTFVYTKGHLPTSNWLDNQKVIEDSLDLLKYHGIVGIRLVIFPHELTKDGMQIDWKPIDTMVKLCHKTKLLVDLCIGPFQYPYYPGIYLPEKLRDEVFPNENALDTVSSIRRFGMNFLTMQLERYGESNAVRGFHFANEWPDKQVIAGKEAIKKRVSEDFMMRAVKLIKERTEKPIRLNTNISLFDNKKLITTFSEIFSILQEQGYLGLDIYPSQETWFKTPFHKVLLSLFSYGRTFRKLQKIFQPSQLYFAEIEAQPWGNGKAWFTLISQADTPHKKILTYSRRSLNTTWQTYLKNTTVNEISLWGSDFWLVSNAMEITWPLKQVKNLLREVRK